MLTPLSWVAIILFVIGFIAFILMNIFIEFTDKGKFWFVLTVAAWGVICIVLIVWSFIGFLF